MKKKNIYKLLYVVSLLLLLGFVIRLSVDYMKYDITMTSAPFYIFIIERTIEFILPSIIIFVIGLIIKKKRG